MNKVKSLFKASPIAMVVASLAILATAGVASAALVNYLSNTEKTVADINSPIELKLYDTNSVLLGDPLSLKGGESIDFYKIAHNNADVGTRFAIALAIENVVASEVTVDSAGPCPGDATNKNNIAWYVENGQNIWNNVNPQWCQKEGQDWYLHDAYNKHSTYEWWNTSTNAWVNGVNPKNTVYDDGGIVKIGETNYYFVVFGGTIGTGANGAIGSWEKITNEGWGTPSGYTSNSGGAPNVMIPGVADVGKVRISFAQNSDPNISHEVRMTVVQPGSTVADVITAMGF